MMTHHISPSCHRVAVCEKGWANVRLRVSGAGGHSSIPPLGNDAAMGHLAAAIAALHDTPQPSMFGKGVERDFLAALAPKVSAVASCHPIL